MGTFKKEPGKGAQLKINGTYNGNDSEYFVAPLCEFVSVVQDRIPQCPPKKGNATISYVFGIYDFYDDGNYTVRVEALTEDKRRLFCLLATVIWKS